MSRRDAILRCAAAVVMVLTTGAFVTSRSSFERIPQSEQLENFPRQVVSWTSRDMPIDMKVREVLGEGRFLSRGYLSPSEPPIDVFIGYYPTQRTGSTPHSPQNCLPGAGWVFSESKLVSIPLPAGGTFHTREYLIAKGAERALVFYWYQAHGRAITSDYSAKMYLFLDAVRMNRTDGALVRVMTPLRNGEAVESGRARLTQFVGPVVPVLNRFIPD
jgi:EpsI family protein